MLDVEWQLEMLLGRGSGLVEMAFGFCLVVGPTTHSFLGNKNQSGAATTRTITTTKTKRKMATTTTTITLHI